MTAPMLSVVIPTYNRPALLLRCLRTLSTQVYPADRAEIVVIEYGSDRLAPAAVYAAANGRPTRVIHVPRGGVGAARARGVAEAMGEIVAFLDDDCTVPPDYLASVAAAFAESSVDVVQVALENPEPRNLYGRAWERVWKMAVAANSERGPNGRLEIRLLGGVMAARRRLFERVRFEPALEAREDLDLRLQLEVLGTPIVYDPRIRVFNHCRRTLGEFLRQHVTYGRGEWTLRRKWGPLETAGDIDPTSGHALRAMLREEGVWDGLAIYAVLWLRRKASGFGRLQQQAIDRSGSRGWRYGLLFRVAWQWLIARSAAIGVARRTGGLLNRWRTRHLLPVRSPGRPTPRPMKPEPDDVLGPDAQSASPLRRPVAVMIDNSRGAHPQSGLTDATIVIEAPVEGGLTRLMAVYTECWPEAVGPVRSARAYFVEWAEAFQPIFIHCGASPDARRCLREPERVIGLECVYEKCPDGTLVVAQNGDVCRLDPHRTPPHHVFVGLDDVHTLLPHLQLTRRPPGDGDTSVDLQHYCSGAALAVAPGHSSAMPAARVNVMVDRRAATTSVFTWDDRCAGFRRTVLTFGQRVSDDDTLRIANLVTIETSVRPVPGDLRGRLQISTTGHGAAHVWCAGANERAVWQRVGPDDSILLRRPDGTPLSVRPGLTWIVVLGAGGVVSESPAKPSPASNHR